MSDSTEREYALAPDAGAPPLATQDVTVRFATRAVLSDVSVTIQAGQIVGVLGPNGSGKTTLVRAFAGLQAVAGGTVRVQGHALHGWSRRNLARAIAYYPQGQHVEWPVPARRVVELGRIPHVDAWQRPAPQDRAAVDAAMAQTGVEHLADRRCTTLSGGERARVLLARALAVEAPILLADEPVASLDPHHQIAIMDVLSAVARAGRCVVAVLHDLTFASRYCDHVIVLCEGRVVSEGPPERALTPAVAASAFGIQAVQGSIDGQRYMIPWAISRDGRPTGVAPPNV